MVRRVELYIPLALEAIISTGISVNGRVPREFNGYISSFGASIIQSGLKPAIAFFESKTSNAQEHREKVPEAILKIISDKKYNSLLKFVISNESSETKAKIMDAATALKLAIRTFEFSKEDIT